MEEYQSYDFALWNVQWTIPVLRSSWYTAFKTKKTPTNKKKTNPKNLPKWRHWRFPQPDALLGYRHITMIVLTCPVILKWAESVSFSCVGNTRFSRLDWPKPHGTCPDLTADSAHSQRLYLMNSQGPSSRTILWSYEAKSPGSVCRKNVRWQLYLKVVYHNADDLNHQDVLL